MNCAALLLLLLVASDFFAFSQDHFLRFLSSAEIQQSWVKLLSPLSESSQLRTNSGIPNCRQILSRLSHQGRIQRVTYPFSTGSFRLQEGLCKCLRAETGEFKITHSAKKKKARKSESKNTLVADAPLLLGLPMVHPEWICAMNILPHWM